MRRYYTNDESKVRLTNYTSYYAELEDYLNTNFEKFEQRKIMFKWRKRKFKLRRRLSKDRNLPETFKSRKRNKKTKNLLKKLQDSTVYLDQIQISNSLFNDPLKPWEQNHENFNLNLMDHEIFESVHDIYDPSFSSEDELTLKTSKRIDQKVNSLEGDYFEDKIKDYTNNSIITRITDFERMDESKISMQKNSFFSKS